MRYNKIRYQPSVFIGSGEMSENTRVFFNEFVYKRRKILSREEEADLIKKAQSGNKVALEKFFRYNQPLVYNIAKHYVRNNIDITFDDMIQEANIGMMDALERVDTSKGVLFSTYATFFIKRYCANYISKTLYNREHKSLHLISEFKKAIEKHIHQYESYPDHNALYHQLGYKKQQIDLLTLVFNRPTYLDAPLGEDFSRYDIYPLLEPGFESYDENKLKEVVRQIIDLLSPRQREIAILFWGLNDEDPLMAKEIAEKLNMKHKSVEKMLNRTRKQIRKYQELSIMKSLLN